MPPDTITRRFGKLRTEIGSAAMKIYDLVAGEESTMIRRLAGIQLRSSRRLQERASGTPNENWTKIPRFWTILKYAVHDYWTMPEDTWDEEAEAWQEWLEREDSPKSMNRNLLYSMGILEDLSYGGQFREFLPGGGRLYSQAARCFDRYS